MASLRAQVLTARKNEQAVGLRVQVLTTNGPVSRNVCMTSYGD